jgi:hypothetical protein
LQSERRFLVYLCPFLFQHLNLSPMLFGERVAELTAKLFPILCTFLLFRPLFQQGVHERVKALVGTFQGQGDLLMDVGV